MGKYIEIGKLTGTHALKGELKMVYWCDDPDFLVDLDLFFLDEAGKENLAVERARFHKNFLIIKIKDVDDIDTAQKYINKVLYIDKEKIKLNDGEYLQCDLIGLTVLDVDSNENYGKIFKITQTGANDVYYIKNNDGRECLIPAIKDVIKKVDLENNLMYIKPLNGLFDL